MSQSFADLCCRALRTHYPEQTITESGQWWYDDHEIDVVGITTGETLIVGVCKFTQAPLGYDAFSKLQDHVAELRWTPEDAHVRDETYALFSRSGFTSAVEEAAAGRDDLDVFTAEDVVEALT